MMLWRIEKSFWDDKRYVVLTALGAASLFVLCVMLSLGFGFWAYRLNWNYDKQIGSYLQLADDASTAGLKLEYLRAYRDAVQRHIQREDACFFFKTPRTTVRTQFAVLDSLIHRVYQASLLTEGSLEYQQAMFQITGQEFDGALEDTNSILRAAYLKQSGLLKYLVSQYVFCIFFGVISAGLILLYY